MVETAPADGQVDVVAVRGVRYYLGAPFKAPELQISDVDIEVLITDQRLTVGARRWIGDVEQTVVGLSETRPAEASRHMAGHALVGQVRHEWLHYTRAIPSGWRQPEELGLGCTQDDGTPTRLTFTLAKGTSAQKVARELMRRVARHRLNVGDETRKATEHLRAIAESPETYETRQKNAWIIELGSHLALPDPE